MMPNFVLAWITSTLEDLVDNKESESGEEGNI